MWHALERQFEGVERKLEDLVWFIIFKEKRKIAI
jgi:hypothetical protein